MMELFLKEVYEQAYDLDDQEYDSYFPPECDRADFLLFGNQVICESKKIEKIKVGHQVEKLSCKGRLSGKVFERDFYNSIRQALRKANKQIGESKKALNIPNALGLVILENLIQDDLSILSLINAAETKMLEGLVNVDCVLCLDFANTFSSQEDGHLVRPAQILVRDTDRSKKLCELVEQLMRTFCEKSGMPFLDSFNIEQGSQTWATDIQSKYKKYKARIDFDLPVSEAKFQWNQQVAQTLNNWWWLVVLIVIFYFYNELL
ncbi:hypothetical protein [Adonisia turfae]|nr:hypothetical protein [Adonisia turfae]